jgi:hypothetical protein
MTSDEVPDDESAEYGLVMPYVVCASKDGPYEDGAFVAGIYFGEANTILREAKPDKYERYIPSPLVPQLDLVAMKEGYELTAEPWDEHPDEWTLCTFRRLPLQESEPTA